MGTREHTDVTEDLTEAQLAEAAFGEDIVVMWGDPRQWGIISGYIDPGQGQTRGHFRVDPAERLADGSWVETSSTADALTMARDEFTVFGPANRDPGDLPNPENQSGISGATQAAVQEALINLGSYGPMAPFLAAMVQLLGVRDESQRGSPPAFRVRLDADVRAERGDHTHRYRVLVRPTEQPMMHNELQTCLVIADRYELACSLSNVGVEIHRPEEL